MACTGRAEPTNASLAQGKHAAPASKFAEFEHEAASARSHLPKRVITAQIAGKVYATKIERPVCAIMRRPEALIDEQR